MGHPRAEPLQMGLPSLFSSATLPQASTKAGLGASASNDNLRRFHPAGEVPSGSRGGAAGVCVRIGSAAFQPPPPPPPNGGRTRFQGRDGAQAVLTAQGARGPWRGRGWTAGPWDPATTSDFKRSSGLLRESGKTPVATGGLGQTFQNDATLVERAQTASSTHPPPPGSSQDLPGQRHDPFANALTSASNCDHGNPAGSPAREGRGTQPQFLGRTNPTRTSWRLGETSGTFGVGTKRRFEKRTSRQRRSQGANQRRAAYPQTEAEAAVDLPRGARTPANGRGLVPLLAFRQRRRRFSLEGPGSTTTTTQSGREGSSGFGQQQHRPGAASNGNGTGRSTCATPGSSLRGCDDHGGTRQDHPQPAGAGATRDGPVAPGRRKRSATGRHEGSFVDGTLVGEQKRIGDKAQVYRGLLGRVGGRPGSPFLAAAHP